MQVPHILHHVFSGTVYAGSVKPQFYSPQIGHGDNTTEQMASYFAVSPVPEGPHSDQSIILTEPEPVLYLPAVQAGFHDFRCAPVGVVGDDDVFTEHCALPLHRNRILPETHDQALGRL